MRMAACMGVLLVFRKIQCAYNFVAVERSDSAEKTHCDHGGTNENQDLDDSAAHQTKKKQETTENQKKYAKKHFLRILWWRIHSIGFLSSFSTETLDFLTSRV